MKVQAEWKVQIKIKFSPFCKRDCQLYEICCIRDAIIPTSIQISKNKVNFLSAPIFTQQ